MKIVLHIGWHKTGSTAIQKFLLKNRQALLARFGILYPETGRFTVAHHLAAWSLQEPLRDAWALSIGFQEKAEELFAGIFQEAKKAGATIVLISSEAFLNSICLDRLACLVSGHEVHVVVYVRRQDRAAESLYGQMVRQFESRYSLEFESYIVHLGRWLDYTAVLDAWERAIPGVVVEPRVYERSMFPQGNVVADFLAAIGLDMPVGGAGYEGDVNASLGPLSIHTLAKINATYQFNKEVHEGVVELLREIDASEDALQAGFFDSKARTAFLRQFESSNEVLFHRWLKEPNAFALSSEELARYAAQNDTRSPQAVIEKAVQARLRIVGEYLNSANKVKSNLVPNNSITDRFMTSVTTTKPASSNREEGADKLRDAGMAAIARGDWPQALECLREAHQFRPGGPFIQLQLARVLLELGRPEEARPHLDSVARNPAVSGLNSLLSELQERLRG